MVLPSSLTRVCGVVERGLGLATLSSTRELRQQLKTCCDLCLFDVEIISEIDFAIRSRET